MEENQNAILDRLNALDTETERLEAKVEELLRQNAAIYYEQGGKSLTQSQEGTIMDVVQTYLLSSQPGDYLKKNAADKCVVTVLHRDHIS